MFEALYSPFKIGSMSLRNRMVMSAMGTGLGTKSGEVTPSLIAYYKERALGGVGCVTSENVAIHATGKSHANMLGIYSDDYILGIRQLVDAVHEAGAKIAIQLNHAGRQTSSWITGERPVAPSCIPCPLLKEAPVALTTDEIENIIESFAIGAWRAREAGSDAVEFHMAHGYLICQFLSPYSNHREDDYGGTLQNRTRFALEILRRTREKVGIDFPIICKVSADEMVEGGLDLNSSRKIASLLVEAGANAIVVSACNYASYAFNIPCYYMQEGCFIPFAREIKSAVDTTVIGVGRIRRLDMAEMLVREGVVDLVALGRSLIADPQLPAKGAGKNQEGIRPCLSCNRCFESLSFRKMRLSCTVNPFVGEETKWRLGNRKHKKHILVVGGGVGGMEAARLGALLGHEITLFERHNELGGQLLKLSSLPGKAHYRELIDYYVRELESLPVDVRTDKECIDKLVMEIKPDAIILATGAKAVWPEHIGGEGSVLMDFLEVLERPADIGDNVAVVGGGPEGAEIADYLSSRGKRVTIIEMKPKIGHGLPSSVRYHLENRVRAHGVHLQTQSEVLSIDGMSIRIKYRRRNLRMLCDFDTVILAFGRRPENALVEKIAPMNIPYHLIGDAKEPRRIQHAIREAAAAVFQLCGERMV